MLPIAGGATDGKPATKITIKRITVKSSSKAPATTHHDGRADDHHHGRDRHHDART